MGPGVGSTNAGGGSGPAIAQQFDSQMCGGKLARSRQSDELGKFAGSAADRAGGLERASVHGCAACQLEARPRPGPCGDCERPSFVRAARNHVREAFESLRGAAEGPRFVVDDFARATSRARGRVARPLASARSTGRASWGKMIIPVRCFRSARPSSTLSDTGAAAGRSWATRRALQGV